MDPKEIALQAAQRLDKKYGIHLNAYGGSSELGFKFACELSTENGLIGTCADYANTLKKINADFAWDSDRGVYYMRTNRNVRLVVLEKRSGMVLSFNLFPPRS